MDKFEYKIRAEEINALIGEGKYAEAVEIADTIDWRRVKSVMMLCKISDLYKINRRYPESRDILLLAYEKHPTRLIIYSLCELAIKMEEYVQAIEYYKEFVQIAPKDTGRYILQYRLYEAQDVSLEERIAVLEEFKKRDYREKWAYELAYLYHRIGLSTKCVEECDEMFLWFGEGKYVVKALELKKLHEPLNDDQQDKYELWMQARESAGEPYEEQVINNRTEIEETSGNIYEAGNGIYRRADDIEDNTTEAEPATAELPEVKTVDVGQYNTINLQMALAESMREIMGEEEADQETAYGQETPSAEAAYEQELPETEAAYGQELPEVEAAYGQETPSAETVYGREIPTKETAYEQESLEMEAAYGQESPAAEAAYEQESPAAEATYEQKSLETEIAYRQGDPTDEAAYEQESPQTATVFGQENPESEAFHPDEAAYHGDVTTGLTETGVPETERKQAEQPYDYMEIAKADGAEETMQEEDETEPDDEAIRKSLIAPLMEETIRMPDHRTVERKLREASVTQFPKRTETVQESGKAVMDTDNLREVSRQIAQDDTASFDAQQILEQMREEVQKESDSSAENQIPGAKTGVLTPLNTKPSRYDNFLSQEYDGQISLVIPEAEQIEKQITGQLSIEDIMAEWEEMKKSNEQKRMEDVRQRILEHTGDLFANFDEATKNGLLEELERAFVAAIMKESGKKPAIKKVVLPEGGTDKNKKLQLEKESKPEPLPKEVTEKAESDETKALMEPDDSEADETAVSTEQEAEEIFAAETAEEEKDLIRERQLTEEERELFGEFVHHRKSERQLVQTLDNMSLAPYTGNVLITGEEDDETLALAKSLIREMQINDSNFSGKIAKISGAVLNKKDVEEIFGKLDNGALIIEKASRIKPATAAGIAKALDRDNMGLLVLMADKKADINELLAENGVLQDYFNLRVDIEALDDEALVAYARQYAEDQEYSIDEFGILALHTRIADRQTSDHEVNLSEVRELVDEAIYHANRKTPGHFMDILLAKRYDEDDMIILREKDFMHY